MHQQGKQPDNRLAEAKFLDSYVISCKVVLQPVCQIFFIIFAPLYVCHHFLFSLLLCPRSCASTLLLVEALQLNKEESQSLGECFQRYVLEFHFNVITSGHR